MLGWFQIFILVDWLRIFFYQENKSEVFSSRHSFQNFFYFTQRTILIQLIHKCIKFSIYKYFEKYFFQVFTSLIVAECTMNIQIWVTTQRLTSSRLWREIGRVQPTLRPTIFELLLSDLVSCKECTIVHREITFLEDISGIWEFYQAFY